MNVRQTFVASGVLGSFFRSLAKLHLFSTQSKSPDGTAARCVSIFKSNQTVDGKLQNSILVRITRKIDSTFMTIMSRFLAFALILAAGANFSTAAELVVSKTGIANTFDGIGTSVIVDTFPPSNSMYVVVFLFWLTQAGLAVAAPQVDC